MCDHQILQIDFYMEDWLKVFWENDGAGFQRTFLQTGCSALTVEQAKLAKYFQYRVHIKDHVTKMATLTVKYICEHHQLWKHKFSIHGPAKCKEGQSFWRASSTDFMEITKIKRAATLDFALVFLKNIHEFKASVLSSRNSQRMPSQVNVKVWIYRHFYHSGTQN